MVTAERIEKTTLKNLLHNEDYTRKVLPFLKPEYFDDRTERIVFSEIQKFISQYNKRPTKETLQIDIGKRKDLNEDEYKKIVDLVSTLNKEEIDLDWLDNLALHTQIVIKKSTICYAHGRILYSCLSKYISNSSLKNDNITILETGTSRGFSSVCMAKSLFDNQFKGKILTIDYLPHDKKFYWNCLDDHEGKKTRRELLSYWRDLCKNYIIFIEGYSKEILKKIKIDRINFAFLDASHTYSAIYNEFKFISKYQVKGDIIVFDDYGNKSYLGLKIAIDEICKKYKYKKLVINATSQRGYLIATKT